MNSGEGERSNARRRLRGWGWVGICILVGCGWMKDNGTHLAYALEKGAKRLQESNRDELVVTYTPLSGARQIYSIHMGPTESNAYLSVRGKNPGSTTYHHHFVYVPKEFFIVKTNAKAKILLRKMNGRIEVAELR